MTLAISPRPTISSGPANAWVRAACHHLACVAPVIAVVVPSPNLRNSATIMAQDGLGIFQPRYNTVMNRTGVTPLIEVTRDIDQAIRGALASSTTLIELL